MIFYSVYFSRDFALYLVASVLFFWLAQGVGASGSGLNPDDWYNQMGSAWAWEEGRWLIEIIFFYGLGGSMADGAQILLAAVLYALVPLLIISDKPNYPLSFLAFSIMVSHPFMAEVLNFNIGILPFALGAFLTAAGTRFTLTGVDVDDAGSRWTTLALRLIVSITALVLAFSIYQPLVVVAFATIGSHLLWSVTSDVMPPSIGKTLVLGALLVAAAVLIYAGVALITIPMADGSASPRFSEPIERDLVPMYFAETLAKLVLVWIGYMFHSYPEHFHYLAGAMIISIGLSGALIATRRSERGSKLSPARVAISLIIVFVPFALLALAFGHFRIRVQYLIGLPLGLFATFFSAALLRDTKVGRSLGISLLVIAVLFMMSSLATSSALWQIQKLRSDRDMTALDAIYTDFLIFTRENNVRRDSLNVFGSSKADFRGDDIGQVWSMGRSILPLETAPIISLRHGIATFGNDHMPDDLHCAAFPAVGAWLVVDGVASVCLQDFP